MLAKQRVSDIAGGLYFAFAVDAGPDRSNRCAEYAPGPDLPREPAAGCRPYARSARRAPGQTDAAIAGRAAAQADNQMPTPGVQRRLYLFAQPVAAGLTHIRCAGGVSSSPQLCAISIMARSPGRIRKSACRERP